MDKEAVRTFFDALAPEWDLRQQVDREKFNRILDAAGVRPGVRVLDVACGTGVMIPFYLERQADRVLGLDLSREMIRRAEEKFAEESRVSFQTADAETGALSPAFDCVMVFNALPHFSDLAALLGNLAQALVPGGRLTLAHDRGRAALARHHAGVPSGVSQRIPSAGELAVLLRQAGLRPRLLCDEEGLFIVTGDLPL